MTDTLKINIPDGTALDQHCIALLSAIKAYNHFQQAKMNYSEPGQDEAAKHAREKIMGSAEDIQYAEQTLTTNLHELSNNLSEVELTQALEKQLISEADHRELLGAVRVAGLIQVAVQKENHLER